MNSTRRGLGFVGAACVVLLCSLGCKKSNALDVQGRQGGVRCDDTAECSGACVDGTCREFCDANYQCPARESCVSIDDVAVCVPETNDFEYSPYRALDLLSGCGNREGCQATLDAVEVQGSFRECSSQQGLRLSDFENPNFDYAAACADVADYGRLDISERRSYEYYGDRCETALASGMAGTQTLIESCYSDGWRAHTRFSRVVQLNGEVYLWREGPYPHTGPAADDWYGDWEEFHVVLYKRVTTTVEAPTSCVSENSDCHLPTFPRIGPPASNYRGLWVECDGELSDCDAAWGETALNDFRTVIYVREDGFGEVMLKGGDAYDPQPTTCTAAFRQGGDLQVLVLGHHDYAIGDLRVERRAWLPLTDEGNDYLVEFALDINETMFDTEDRYPDATYRKVPFPEGFQDPCEHGLPQFKF